jgi:uncharacterized membrane protein
MAWYWWILIGILGLNVLVIALVALFLVLDSLRSRRAAARREQEARRTEAAEQGGRKT